jgi:short-subunit dehydrogenase
MKASTFFKLTSFAVGIGCGVAIHARKRRQRFSFYGRSVVITGGSRGLGLVMARELGREGARLSILARDQAELQRAEEELRETGANVLTVTCDLCKQEEVNSAMRQVIDRHGGVDVLINNAGMIQVGPLDHMTVQDFEDALAIHLFAPLYATLAVLPHMRAAGSGRIANISSIGGKVAMPHLLPYTASKFALTGFSDGLRAELRRENIFVTTVCPGLMRTGSPRHALFKGRHEREYAWFAIADSLPFLSLDAERAARRIIEACRRGSARLIIGIPARAAVFLNEIFPGAATALMSLTNRLLPGTAEAGGHTVRRGYESQSKFAPSFLTRATERAAAQNNQVA